MNYINKILTTLTLAAFVMVGCDVTDQEPKQSVASESVFTTEDGANAALNGAYDAYQDVLPDDYVFSELAGDLAGHTGSFPSWSNVDQHNLLPTNAEARDLWIFYYDLINITNNVIAQVPQIDQEGFTDAEKNQIVAEAKILRGLSYHTLVRFFGAIPMPLEPTRALDESVFLPRTSVADVYSQIASDWSDAASTSGSAGAIRATGLTATALLSRASLYLENYQDAIDFADQVLGAGPIDFATPGADIIFQLPYSSEDFNNLSFFALPNGSGGRYEYGPTQDYIGLFDPADTRFDENLMDVNADGTLELGKYRLIDGDDNVPVIRAAELHLIRAEANLELGADDETVLADIDPIREAAGLAPLFDPNGNADQYSDQELLDEILLQRAIELAQEGHRWHDLNRLGLATSTFGINANMTLWPIPQRDMDTNPALEGNQNPGY